METRPNLLLISTDQQRPDSLGCYGNPIIGTPNLDGLAARGTRFDRAYVGNPLCMPSRTSILTGQYPSNHGLWCNGVPQDEERRTVATALAEAGYHTALLGKAHFNPYDAPAESGLRESFALWRDNPALAEWHGPYFGFEQVSLVLAHHFPTGHYGAWLDKVAPAVKELFYAERKRIFEAKYDAFRTDVPVKYHASTWVGDIATEYLQGRAGSSQPFFAWVSFPDPHHPFCPPSPYWEMYDPAAVPGAAVQEGELDDKPPHFRAFREGRLVHEGRGAIGNPGALTEEQFRRIIAATYGMVTQIDENVGRILRTLEETGLAKNTAVMFVSDHGELLGDHGLIYKGPFLYESLLRVPMIVAMPPALRSAGGATESRALVSLVDLAPTLLDLAGVAAEGMDGRSLVPLLSGTAEAWREHLLVEYQSGYFPDLNLRTVVTEEWKLTYYPGKPYGELYHLAADPKEFRNLYGLPEYADIQRQLVQKVLDNMLLTEARSPSRMGHS